MSLKGKLSPGPQEGQEGSCSGGLGAREMEWTPLQGTVTGVSELQPLSSLKFVCRRFSFLCEGP